MFGRLEFHGLRLAAGSVVEGGMMHHIRGRCGNGEGSGRMTPDGGGKFSLFGVVIEADEDVAEGVHFVQPLGYFGFFVGRPPVDGAGDKTVVACVGDERVLRVGLRYEFLGSALTKPTAGLDKLS